MSADDRRIVLANKLFKDKSIGVDDICATLKISKSTLYRYVGIERRSSASAAGRKKLLRLMGRSWRFRKVIRILGMTGRRESPLTWLWLGAQSNQLFSGQS